MKNFRTPRSLEQGHWQTGYGGRVQRTDWSSVILACAIGIALALVLVYGGM